MKFAVVSDVHAEQHNDWSRLVFSRMGARTDLDFVAFLGDICTSPGDSWEQWFRPLQDMIHCPIYACRGNHDDRERWRKWWGTENHVYHDCFNGHEYVRFVFIDSNIWDKETIDWIDKAFDRAHISEARFVFTHLTPRIGHWNYGMASEQTFEYLNLLFKHDVVASFTGHMHGFDHLRFNKTDFFICGGGGGGEHGNFPILHRSNYYLVCEWTGWEERLKVTLCQQHRDREEAHPMESWGKWSRRTY